MKTMNNRKRVSFGSKGSMVETWIIEDLPTPRSTKEEEFISSFVTHSKSDPGLHGHTTPLPATATTTTSESSTTAGLPPWGLSSPLRDAKNRVLLLSDPQGLSPKGLEGRNGTFYLTDRVTGWPLKRSPSLESRDNPFLPGGDLSKEAEELLKKATIVRDKFYLNQDGQYVPHPSPGQHHRGHHDAPDGTLLANAANNNNAVAAAAVLEERISPAAASKAEAAPVASAVEGGAVPRENGKAGDGVVGGTSPDGVRLEVGGSSPTADGSKGVGSDSAGAAPGGGGGGEQQDKDKAKRRPKCCAVM